MSQSVFKTLRSILFAIILSLGLGYAYAWTGPTDTAPGANTPAPINQGGDIQTKIGQFWSTAGIGTSGGMYALGIGSFGTVQLNDIVVEGTLCGTSGVVSRDVNGTTLSCQSGNWKRAGVSTQIISGPVSACNTSSVAVCPAGMTIIGGGGEMVNSCPTSSVGSPCNSSERTPTVSMPTSVNDPNNAWAIVYECSTSRAYAICAKY